MTSTGDRTQNLGLIIPEARAWCAVPLALVPLAL
ncbi:MAG: hypothetical protein QOF70_7535 [Acetobacteraceae bacterium]|jgi:hypothetical protein|nr:hypothetical protein [Acetobacteraceae bacterium]